MQKIKLDIEKIISQVSGVPVCDTYDGFFYDYEGYIKVILKKDKKNVLYNFVNAEGKEISPIWFKDVGKFKNGLVEVTLTDDSKNIMTSEGNLILRKNNKYTILEPFYNFYRAYGSDGRCCLISNQGKQVKLQWFDSICPLDKENKGKPTFFMVKRRDKYNIMNDSGEYILEKFFLKGYKVGNMFMAIYPVRNPKFLYHKFIDLRTGKVIVEGEFLNVELYMSKKCFILRNTEGYYNILTDEGKFLLKDWYDEIKVGEFVLYDTTFIVAYKKFSHKPQLVLTLFDIQGNNIVENMWFDSFETICSIDSINLKLHKKKYTYVYNFKENKVTLI